MVDREKILKYYLHLSNLNIVGRVRHDILLKNFGSIPRALEASYEQLCACNGISESTASKLLSPMNHASLEKDILNWKDNRIKISLLTDDDYPENLRQNADAPIMLQIKGNYIEEDRLAIAIVGSRNCSDYGKKQAYAFGRALAEKGFTIISGMARGVDSAAHRGALDAGQRTIAVQAGGLSKIYPASGKELAEQIAHHGALISEMSWAMPPMKQNFPRRNRIVSGLSIGTLVIEAAQKSGSLITARWAMEQNREVFALPGRIDNPLSLGCHKLIQDGAKLVTEIEDIVNEFPGLILNTKEEGAIHLTMPPLDEHQKKVITAFQTKNNKADLTFNTLQELSDLSSGDLNLALFKLETQNLITALPQKTFRLAGAALIKT